MGVLPMILAAMGVLSQPNDKRYFRVPHDLAKRSLEPNPRQGDGTSKMVAVTLVRLCGAIAFLIIFEVCGAIAEGLTFNQQYSFVAQNILEIPEIIANNSGSPLIDGGANLDTSIPNQEELEALTDGPEVIIIDFTYLGFESPSPLVQYFDSRNEISLSVNYGITKRDLRGCTPVNLSTIGMVSRRP